MRLHATGILFYGFVFVANALVGVMFYTITIPPPIATAQMTAPYMPKVPRIIPAIIGKPTRLVVPSLGLDMRISTGSYNNDTGNWTSGYDRAYYADVSLPANDSNGTTLIYGHARTGIFASLPDLKPGAGARIYTNTRNVFSYTFKSTKNVVPNDTSIFQSGGPPTLVLQTCTGAWDKYRALYSFDFVKVTRP